MSLSTHRFIPCPVSGHKIRPYTIICVVKLPVRFIVEHFKEVGCCNLVVDENSRISCTKFIGFYHPVGGVRGNCAWVFEVYSHKWCIAFLYWINHHIHFLGWRPRWWCIAASFQCCCEPKVQSFVDLPFRWLKLNEMIQLFRKMMSPWFIVESKIQINSKNSKNSNKYSMSFYLLHLPWTSVIWSRKPYSWAQSPTVTNLNRMNLQTVRWWKFKKLEKVALGMSLSKVSWSYLSILYHLKKYIPRHRV